MLSIELSALRREDKQIKYLRPDAKIQVTLQYERQVWLVYPHERRRMRKIAAFREWLLDCVALDPAIAIYEAQAGPRIA